MSRKEWREVFRQSLYFVLAMAAMALLVGTVDLVSGSRSEGEKIVVMAGLWLLVFSMFLGLTPFAMDSKQKGMEYLLTLPIARRRLLLIKFLPRQAAVVIFYIAFVLLYARIGHGAFAGGFAFFSLAYFALFLISFSLSVVDENFIVQSIWAGIALCGYLALCLGIVALGFSWKFRIPASRVGAGIWHDLSYDPATLLAAVAVFLLLASPFIASLFLAFKKFDLKPAKVFNRLQLLLFVPLLILALSLSLVITYVVQKGPTVP
jgi:hypothetical protein